MQTIIVFGLYIQNNLTLESTMYSGNGIFSVDIF